MDQIRIFIASSAELKEDRDSFRIFLSELNDRLQEKGGSYLHLEQWENFLDSVSQNSKQEDYNEKIRECDILICLFHTKAGKYTIEEFETALAQFKKTNRPLIYTYFKTSAPELEPGIDAKNSLQEFKNRLKNIKHFYTLYDNIDQLKNKFRTQLDILEEKGFIELQNTSKQEMLQAVGQYTINNQISAGGDVIINQKVYINHKDEESAEISFNKHFTLEIIDAMSIYNPKARRLMTDTSWIENEDQLKKVHNLICRSFVGEIDKQLRQLIAIGKDGTETSEGKQQSYVSKCIELTKRSFDLIIFTLLSSLWNSSKTTSIQIPDGQKGKLENRFDNDFEYSLEQQFDLLTSLYSIFKDKNLDLPFEELATIEDQFNEDSEMHQACKKLHELSKDKEFQVHTKGYLDAEVQFTSIFKHFAFLVNYRLVSIKRIGYRQIRHDQPKYLQHYAAIGIESNAQDDAERLNCLDTGIETFTVYIYKGNDYTKGLSLFPFVIDIHAVTFESGVNICFYNSRDLLDQNLEFRFLCDNKILALEHLGTFNPGSDLNTLMLDQNNRKNLSLDNVIESFFKARSAILGVEEELFTSNSQLQDE